MLAKYEQKRKDKKRNIKKKSELRFLYVIVDKIFIDIVIFKDIVKNVFLTGRMR